MYRKAKNCMALKWHVKSNTTFSLYIKYRNVQITIICVQMLAFFGHTTSLVVSR